MEHMSLGMTDAQDAELIEMKGAPIQQHRCKQSPACLGPKLPRQKPANGIKYLSNVGCQTEAFSNEFVRRQENELDAAHHKAGFFDKVVIAELQREIAQLKKKIVLLG